MPIHAHTHACTHTHTHACIHTRTRTHARTHTHTHTHTTPLTFHIVWELFVDVLIGLQCLMVVPTAPVAAGNHQVPLHLVGSAHTTHSTLIKNQALTNMNHAESRKAHATTNLKSVFLSWYMLSEVCLWTGICCLKSIFELAYVVWSLSLNWHMLSEICLPELAHVAMVSE